MNCRIPSPPAALALPLVLVLGACSSVSFLRGNKDTGLSEVDELLSRVELVQVESTVAKEKAAAALGELSTIVAPDFQGDPLAAHLELTTAIEQSDKQAKKLAGSVGPMKSAATSVFQRWTADLEGFGNTKMRLNSQARMEETRARYETVLGAAVSAQLAYDAFNADLRDHALFLEHDFNATSLGMIADEVDDLIDQAMELERRLDSCSSAAREYVKASGLRLPSEVAEVEAAPAEKPRTTEPARTSSARKKAKAAPQPGQATGSAAGTGALADTNP